MTRKFFLEIRDRRYGLHLMSALGHAMMKQPETYASFPDSERLHRPFVPHRILECTEPWIVEVTQPPVRRVLDTDL